MFSPCQTCWAPPDIAGQLAGWLAKQSPSKGGAGIRHYFGGRHNEGAAVRAWQRHPELGRLRRAMEVLRRRTLPEGLLGQAIALRSPVHHAKWRNETRPQTTLSLPHDSGRLEPARAAGRLLKMTPSAVSQIMRGNSPVKPSPTALRFLEVLVESTGGAAFNHGAAISLEFNSSVY